jgi:F-type H+-transporting ATPase subunit delta
LAKRRGEATAQVVSAKKLTEKQLKALAAALKKALGTKVAVEAHVDADLLGGLIVKVASCMVDSSLRTQLQQLRFAMKGIG